MFLCRSCHMTIDGRMAVIHLPRPKPPQECSNCHQLLKGLRKGVCHTCNEYSRRNNGKPRPEFLPNSTKVTVRHLSIMLELRKQGMTYQDIAVCMKLGRRTVSNAINSIKKEIT
jgi:DNA-binding NarL/FixJ family response regulator